MMKKTFSIPFVLPLEGSGDDTVIGGGTGHGGSNPFPMTFDEWKNSSFSIGCDISSDGLDFQDYIYWWIDCNFSQEQWAEYNSIIWGDEDYSWD